MCYFRLTAGGDVLHRSEHKFSSLRTRSMIRWFRRFLFLMSAGRKDAWFVRLPQTRTFPQWRLPLGQPPLAQRGDDDGVEGLLCARDGDSQRATVPLQLHGVDDAAGHFLFIWNHRHRLIQIQAERLLRGDCEGPFKIKAQSDIKG